MEEISIEELLGSLQVHEQHIQKKNGFIVLKQALESKLTLNDRGSHSRNRDRGRGKGHVPNNEPLKIKWSYKALEVDDEAIGENLHLDVETTRTSNATTVKNLDTMPRIAGTELKILPISPK